MNYYQLLEINQDASCEEIKRAYKNMLKKYHPDNFQGDKRKEQEAEDITKQINLAYEILSSPKSRWEYDETLKNTRSYEQSNTYQTNNQHSTNYKEESYNEYTAHSTSENNKQSTYQTNNSEFKNNNPNKKKKKWVYVVLATIFFLCMLEQSYPSSVAPTQDINQQAKPSMAQNISIKTNQEEEVTKPSVSTQNTNQPSSSSVNQDVTLKTKKNQEIIERENYQNDYVCFKIYAEQLMKIIKEAENTYDIDFFNKEWIKELENQVKEWEKEFNNQTMKTEEGKRLKKSLIQIMYLAISSFNKMYDIFEDNIELILYYAIGEITDEQLLEILEIDTLIQDVNRILEDMKKDIKIFEPYIDSDINIDDINFLNDNIFKDINQITTDIDTTFQESGDLRNLILTNYYKGLIGDKYEVVIDCTSLKTSAQGNLLATSFYTKYPDTYYDIEIIENGRNSYTLKEILDGQHTGTYTIISLDNGNLTGQFINIESGNLYDVNLKNMNQKQGTIKSENLYLANKISWNKLNNDWLTNGNIDIAKSILCNMNINEVESNMIYVEDTEVLEDVTSYYGNIIKVSGEVYYTDYYPIGTETTFADQSGYYEIDMITPSGITVVILVDDDTPVYVEKGDNVEFYGLPVGTHKKSNGVDYALVVMGK